MPSLLTIRKATEQDKESVFNFTKRTWRWGDYIPSVWETWLKQGDTLVAIYDTMPIAVVHLQHNGRQSWLEGLRVSDKFRRKGIGTKLVDESIRHLRKKRKSILRLTVDLQNVPSLKLFSKPGFRESFRFYSLEKETPTQKGNSDVIVAKQKHASEAWTFVGKSKELKQSQGLYANWWRWWQLNDKELKRYITNKKCLLHFKGSWIDGILLFQRNKSVHGGESCQICFMSGSRATLVDMIGKLLQIQSSPARYFFALVPQDSKNTRFLQSLSFTERFRFVLMSLSLAPTQYL